MQSDDDGYVPEEHLSVRREIAPRERNLEQFLLSEDEACFEWRMNIGVFFHPVIRATDVTANS